MIFFAQGTAEFSVIHHMSSTIILLLGRVLVCSCHPDDLQIVGEELLHILYVFSQELLVLIGSFEVILAQSFGGPQLLLPLLMIFPEPEGKIR